ncbi:hypothetical protein MKW94_000408, partial [Papaver nudicaule]|nr:hypothetical protein [Papaver nudicaule]
AFTKYRLRSSFVMTVTHNEPARFTAKFKKFISEHTCGVGGMYFPLFFCVLFTCF